MSFGNVRAGVESPYGNQPGSFGGGLKPLAHGAPGYSLDDSEIGALIDFWREFEALAKQQPHFLHLPLRRLRSGGIRIEPEDAIVDYVVGLECLLGTQQEQTELGYRFRVRGSVVVSKSRNERKEHMRKLRDLYTLRSKIVHGVHQDPATLREYLPLAESYLRTVWNWYFTNWRNENDNQRAVESIDEQLVG